MVFLFLKIFCLLCIYFNLSLQENLNKKFSYPFSPTALMSLTGSIQFVCTIYDRPLIPWHVERTRHQTRHRSPRWPAQPHNWQVPSASTTDSVLVGPVEQVRTRRLAGALGTLCRSSLQEGILQGSLKFLTSVFVRTRGSLYAIPTSPTSKVCAK